MLTIRGNQIFQNNGNTINRLKEPSEGHIKIYFNLNHPGETTQRMIKLCNKKLHSTFKKKNESEVYNCIVVGRGFLPPYFIKTPTILPRPLFKKTSLFTNPPFLC